MKSFKQFFSKGLNALFSLTKKRKHRRSKTKRNRKRISKRKLIRGG